MSDYATFEDSQQLLDNYAKQLAKILECDYPDITFEMIDHTRDYAPVNTFPYRPDEDWGLGQYRISALNQVVSTFKMYQMPHCCAYAISCNVHVEKLYRNRGIGKLLNQMRIDMAKLMGFSALLCTDVNHNGSQRKVLEANGWVDIHTIINSRTDNVVHISAINLR